MNNNETFKLPVVRHIQKGIACYTGHLDSTISKQICFADTYPADPGLTPTRIGYQREPDQKRAQDFTRYLQKDEAGFMTPIILNSREALHFEPLDAENSDVGYLLLPCRPVLAKVDGQHRSLGIEGGPIPSKTDGSAGTGKNKGSGGMVEGLAYPFPIPFLLFDNLNPEIEQQLFVKINKEQKKVHMSHVKMLDHRKNPDPYVSLAEQLNDDPQSVWYGLVNFTGAKGSKRSINLQGLQEAIKLLFDSADLRFLGEPQKYLALREFWAVVAQVWPEEWHSVRGTLLRKQIGVLSLSKVGRDYVPKSLKNKLATQPQELLDTSKLYEYLVLLKDEINWSTRPSNGQTNNHYAGTFVGFGGRGGVDSAANVMRQVIERKSNQLTVAANGTPGR